VGQRNVDIAVICLAEKLTLKQHGLDTLSGIDPGNRTVQSMTRLGYTLSIDNAETGLKKGVQSMQL